MGLTTQLFAIITILLFNAYIIHILRKELIEYQYAIGWMLAGLVMLVIAINPRILIWISATLGIGVPLNLIYFAVIMIGLLFTIQMIISITRMRKSIYELTQELSILKKKIQDEDQKADVPSDSKGSNKPQ